jgi:hypothetical protein
MSWKCPKCERTIKHANQVHCCINQNVDTLFENKPQELVYAFDKILSYVFDIDEVEVSATKNCIIFFKTQTFLVIKPMRKELNIKFYLEEPNTKYPFFKVAKYGKQFEHHIRLSAIEEVDEILFDFIKQSYQLFNSKK